ncbi:MAG: DUF1684 domain-containing protein [Bacteroidetes bacterium]|nr:DUF1684 domain-containing protein [Bacteroidota bacterium]MDA0859717.1 DUF1684 domain-containing protein [Bacteroidota bacterium]MDA1317697.1 DUF1684 domain-containing protein [Bacteroidota bacterium]
MKKLFFYCFILTLCTQCKNEVKTFQIDKAYIESLEKERKDRDERRVKYLELCGLFKLDTTGTIFGIDKSNKVSTSPNEINQNIGKFQWDGKAFNFEAFNDIKITDSNGTEIQTKSLILNAIGDSEKLFFNAISWRVITRSGALYLRVWDKNNPAIDAFKGFENYAPNSAFIFEADFEYFSTSKSESVASKLGVNDVANFIGKVQFQYDGKLYSLELGEQGWMMVGDATSGDSTYGGGRYMYIDLPETNGKVTLDFNYLYNPPCRYSEYTTCLFPPRQNILPIAIEAGELLTFKK